MRMASRSSPAIAFALAAASLASGASAFSPGRLQGRPVRPSPLDSVVVPPIFADPPPPPSPSSSPSSSSSSSSALGFWPRPRADAPAAPPECDAGIAAAGDVLIRAAETRSEDPEEVVGALEELERLMRRKCKDDPGAAAGVLENLNGSWRLVFTTGTKTTQDRIKAKVNYFPIKAVQSFDTAVEPYRIENGIYLGDFAVLKFAGPFDFDLRKRRLEFDFTSVSVLGLTVQIKAEEAAKLGASTGLGSEGNVENAARGNRPFFNWISADEDIATARGGGGGLALWRRVTSE